MGLTLGLLDTQGRRFSQWNPAQEYRDAKDEIHQHDSVAKASGINDCGQQKSQWYGFEYLQRFGNNKTLLRDAVLRLRWRSPFDLSLKPSLKLVWIHPPVSLSVFP
jgi:hypothetical protein